MSEIREKLLGPSNVRSQILKVVFLAVILVVAFAFSVALLNLVFGSLRNVPSDRQSSAEYDDLELVDIPFPFSLEELMELFESLGLELTQDMLEDLLDMFDGNFDDIPLDDLAALMAALMFSNVTVFSVYDYAYTSVNDMEDYLWKYECYDQYIDGTWSAIDPDLDTIDLYTDYTEPQYGYTELFKIKFHNLSANAGNNQFTAPTLFSNPYIMQGSVQAQQLDADSVIVRTQTDGLNGTALRVSFDSAVDTDLSYLMRGVSLPTEDDLNGSCQYVSSPSSSYSQFVESYQEINSENLFTYINRPWMTDFKAVYDDLATIILPGDNSFVIANKIRAYLQSYYTLNYSPMPETETDRLNWFCASGEGMYSDFASVFCVLARAFGVPARFVDGFNTRYVEEYIDPIEGTGFDVMYRNIYSWAEIFIPTDAQGNGNWQQFDVYYENYIGTAPIPPFLESNYTLAVMCDGHFIYEPFTYALVDRTDDITLSANLTYNSAPVPDELITFKNYDNDSVIGTGTTNSFGIASITVPVGSSRVAGPNFVIGEYTPNVLGLGYFIVNDTLDITLNPINPGAVNVSDVSNSTISVSGTVEDSLGNFVPYTNLEFSLYENGTSNQFFALSPDTTTADSNGAFSADLFVDGNFVNKGDYQVYANATGTWDYVFPPDTGVYTFPYLTTSSVTGASDPQDLYIDKEVPIMLNFYINNVPSDNAPNPVVTRGSTLSLKAQVLDESGITPLEGVVVDFYDSNGYVDSATTGPTGNTTVVNYLVGIDNATVGPNLLWAQVGYQTNYSYYVLNDAVTFSTVSGPLPLVVNKTEGDYFTVSGYLLDDVSSAAILDSIMTLKMFKGIIEYSYPILVGSGGFFSLMVGSSGMEIGNYTLRLDFNGSFDVTDPRYPYTFNITTITGSYDFTSQLQVTEYTPITIDFWINGTDSSDYNNPVISRYNAVNLTVRLTQGLTVLSGLQVDFYDVTNGSYIGYDITDGFGYAYYTYYTTQHSVAGPHQIRAYYSIYSNYSYFILNDSISITLTNSPDPFVVNCTSSSGRTFVIRGSLDDPVATRSVKYGTITVHLFDGAVEMTPFGNYLTLLDGSTVLNDTGQIFLRYYVNSALTAKNYTIRVNFNGVFDYTAPNNINNPYYFSFPANPNFNSFANGNYELKVEDPYNITISLYINGTSTVYPDVYIDPINYPESFTKGQWIQLTGTITQAGSLASGNADLINDYTGSTIDSISLSSGTYEFIIDTDTLHAGLYRFRVELSGFDEFNMTYVIIDAPVTISTLPPSFPTSIIRGNSINQVINVQVSDGGSTAIEGLQLNLILLDSEGTDVSALYLNLQGSQPVTINNGQCSFTIASILQSCPIGVYQLRIDFNGSLYSDWLLLNDNMTHASSSSITFSVRATTSFDSGLLGFNTNYQPSSPTLWIGGDVLNAWGRLLWDNGSGVSGVYLNLTVEYSLNGTIFAWNVTVLTDINGYFNGTIIVDELFTGLRFISETIIAVNFDPSYNGMDNVIAPLEETYE